MLHSLNRRQLVGEHLPQNRRFALEGHDIARISIHVGIAGDVGDRLAALLVGRYAVGREGRLDLVIGDDGAVRRK